MSISTTYKSVLYTTETLAGGGAPDISATNPLVHNVWDSVLQMDGTTTPSVTAIASQIFTMTSGAVTIDMTALTAVSGSLSLSGSRARFIKFKNPSSNANEITITKGATNGWTPVSGQAFSIPIPPGGEVLLYDGGAGQVVGSGAKTIDVTGTGSQQLQVEIIEGG